MGNHKEGIEHIEKLVMFELPKPPSKNEPYLQQCKKEHWFALLDIATCAREIWLSTDEEMKAIGLVPPAFAKQCAQGWDVYERMLAFKCGLLSAEAGDPFIPASISEGMERLRMNNEKLYQQWSPFMMMLNEDFKKIREVLIDPHRNKGGQLAIEKWRPLALTACHYARLARESGTKVRKEWLTLEPEKFQTELNNISVRAH